LQIGRYVPLSEINIAEANTGIPRAASFDDGIKVALAFVLFFFVLWLIPASWRVYDIHTFYVLRQEGNEANGEVTQSYPGRGRSVYVEYRFSVNGKSYSGGARMIAKEYRVQAPGERIVIRYLPNDPRVNQPNNWEWFSAWEVLFYLMGLTFLGGAGALVVVGWRKRQLMRIGTVVEGRVTGCQPDRNQFLAYYEFTTEDNAWFEGSARMSDECEVGKSIPIIYLRSNPERNDYYPG
jgi:hypothetical protein